MMRPLWVTTKAAVMPSGGSKAAATACATLSASMPGAGPSGSRSPIGHDCVDGSGRVLAMSTGSKKTSSLPIGNVTHPWSPLNLAVRTTPSGSVK